MLAKGESLTQHAVASAQKALEMAGIAPEDVDMVILASSSPDDLFGSATQVRVPLFVSACSRCRSVGLHPERITASTCTFPDQGPYRHVEVSTIVESSPTLPISSPCGEASPRLRRHAHVRAQVRRDGRAGTSSPRSNTGDCVRHDGGVLGLCRRAHYGGAVCAHWHEA